MDSWSSGRIALIGDYKVAFKKYENMLKPFLIKKQKMATSSLYLFAPKNKFQLILAKMMLKTTSIPFLSKWFLTNMMKDKIKLPDYSKE